MEGYIYHILAKAGDAWNALVTVVLAALGK